MFSSIISSLLFSPLLISSGRAVSSTFTGSSDQFSTLHSNCAFSIITALIHLGTTISDS
jgi:hypothetical protein